MEYGFAATVFVVSRYCGKLNDWPGQKAGLGGCRLMSWSQIEELHRQGMEIGAHTLTHPNLVRLTMEEAVRELGESQSEIAQRIGAPVSVFAYPYGAYNPGLMEACRGLFAGCCSTHLGKVTLQSNLWALPRLDMYYFRRPRVFDGMGTRWFEAYVQARECARGVKFLILGNGAPGAPNRSIP
jgi:peptidoglycan/xylan/chitin deacetylase (PgdA/CDA1 family)